MDFDNIYKDYKPQKKEIVVGMFVTDGNYKRDLGVVIERPVNKEKFEKIANRLSSLHWESHQQATQTNGKRTT